MVKPGPGLSDGGGVGQHADSALDLGQVAAGNGGGWLVVDPHLESGGAPVHKLDGPLAFDRGDCGVDILGHHISPVEHAAGHVLAVAGVTLHHGVGRFEAGVGDLCNGECLVVSFLCRDDWRIRDQREVDPRVGHQIGLEFIQIHIESPIEAEGGGDGGDDLGDQAVEVSVGRPFDVEIPEYKPSQTNLFREWIILMESG